MALVTGLTIERPTVFPIGELRGGPLRIARIRQLGEDAPQVALGRLLIAGECPAFSETGEIFAAVMLAKPVESWLAERECGLEIGSRLPCQLLLLRGITLIAR